MTAYHPVSCDFHDQLEDLSTRKRTCQIVYRGTDGGEVMAQGHIVDIYTQNHEEFLKLTDGRIIRLDAIVSVNGNEPS